MLMATKKKDAEAPAATAAGATIRVKATSAGTYPAGEYRFKGDVFSYPADKKLGKWMVQVADGAKTERPAPSRPTPIALGEITAAQRAVDDKLSELGLGGKP